jgi:hypothetical protein
MFGATPAETEDQNERVERMRRMETAKIAPLVVYLASNISKNVTGQVFAVRANEIFLMSQSRPLRSMHTEQGWAPQSIATRLIPAFQSDFYSLDRSQDIFNWDPV